MSDTLAIAMGLVVLLLPALIVGYGAWEDDGPWIGVAVFGVVGALTAALILGGTFGQGVAAGALVGGAFAAWLETVHERRSPAKREMA